jgi:transcriptional regulator with XRE-family HTH domain
VPDIGERVQNVRRLRMWTQARLAKEAGVSPTTVSGIETGKISGVRTLAPSVSLL